MEKSHDLLVDPNKKMNIPKSQYTQNESEEEEEDQEQ